MDSLIKWKVKWVGLCFGAFFFLIISTSYSDDTQLYVFESSARSGSRPQVLIVFDTSGSMNEEEITVIPYEVGGDLTSTTKLYYAKGDGDIPALDSPNFIYQANNGCQSSRYFLENNGKFQGFIREYTFVGDSGSWSELPDELNSSVYTIDCFEDFATSDDLEFSNASDMGQGLPVDSLGSQAVPVPYTYVDADSSEADIASALNKAKLTNLGIGKTVRLWTEHFVTWHHSEEKETQLESRMSIAKRVIEDTLVTTPSVDFGLAVFNKSRWWAERHGGRVVSGIQRLSIDDKIALIDSVNSLDAGGTTPLCETLYEVYRYFAGKSVFYGNDDNSSTPYRDTSIEFDGSYISPFDASQCANRAYVVYMTDGAPQDDDDANSYIASLSGYRVGEKEDGSYLPALAGILNREDVNTNLAGDQYVTTFTIGFSEGAADAAPILQAAADYGGGLYFAANDASQLQAALQQIFSQILEVNASFTSPSIASNNFDRTQTFDSVYYAMFLPNKGPRWRGNLKKFKVTGAGDIIDKNDALAIGLDGNLKSSACSYWTHTDTCSAASGGGDGNDVRIGGVAEHLMNNNSSRSLYGDFGTSGMLSVFSKNNAISRAGSESDLAGHMGVATSQLDALFNWAVGQDVDDDNNDGSTSDRRQDIFGDPLHSKPLAINFGTPTVPDLRILVGTNHGFMHMFKDVGDSVSESWAFMPYELLPNLVDLQVNVPTGVHSVYGLDSPPIAYVETGSDGVEKAWVFFGMRRGGKSYYALDITLPDSPKMMWKISSDSSGMSELGQTWSQPVITFIPKSSVGIGDEGSTPVLIFGAGYSPATKDGVEQGTPDAQGRGVFILDAKTGELIHAFGRMAGSKVTDMPTLTDSIPNSVAVLDANGDRLTDRIYAADTGGNIWRMDLPSSDPFDSTHPWTAFKFAQLGGEELSNDRRFFSEPVAVQTVFTNISEVSIEEDGEITTTVTYQNVPYDAVVIGTGHRAQPSDLSRSDKFFTLQDRNVVTQSFTGTEDEDIPEPLTLENLYDVTAAPPETESEYLAFGQKRGWYYHFADDGEKSLAAAAIVEGTVFFTSYVPGDLSDTDQCLISGMGRLYGFNLHRGTRAYTQEYLEMGERVPDTPQLVIPANGSDDSYMYLIGIGAAGEEMEKIEDVLDDCPPEDSQCIGGQPGVNRIYVHGHE